LKEAQKSGADFAQLARRYSEDKKTWVNGEVGWVASGSMPSDYWDKTYEMKEGEIDGPVRSYKGFHVIKLHEIRDVKSDLKNPETVSKVKSSISRVYRDTVDVISKKYLEDVKKSFKMKINNKSLALLKKKLGDKNTPKNMNVFSSFTPEERQLNLVEDELGGVKIQELVDMYGDHRFPPPIDENTDMIKDFLDPILLPRYLTEIARKEGYMNHPDALAEAMKAIENAILPEVEREMVFNKATPSEDEVNSYYNNNITEFTEAPTATVYEVMVDDKQLANDILGRINKGEDIAKLARRYSQRKLAKQKGGKLGPFPKGKYGAISKKAFDIKEGEIAGPISFGGKYSIIKLISTQAEVVKPLDEVRRQIESNMRFEKQKGLKEAWEDELRKQYNVQVDESVIKRVWPILDPLPESLEDERKTWKKEREEAGKQAKLRAKEDQLKLKLRPNSEQEFTTKDGKKVQVKIGEPRYVNKEGKEIDAKKSNIRLTPKGKLEKKDGSKAKGNAKPSIKLTPKGN